MHLPSDVTVLTLIFMCTSFIGPFCSGILSLRVHPHVHSPVVTFMVKHTCGSALAMETSPNGAHIQVCHLTENCYFFTFNCQTLIIKNNNTKVTQRLLNILFVQYCF